MSIPVIFLLNINMRKYLILPRVQDNQRYGDILYPLAVVLIAIYKKMSFIICTGLINLGIDLNKFYFDLLSTLRLTKGK